MSELVSVIIPTHNSVRWVRETIASVLAQDCPSFEVVVVDDGSSDGTIDACRSIPGLITIVEQVNHGRGSARNRGLNAARGDYVSFLDHDDLLLPGSLSDCPISGITLH